MPSKAFSSAFVFLFLFGAFASAPNHAAAQESGGRGLVDILGELLNGREATPSGEAPAPLRRVPFGQDEMQLSFAPLVRQTAPAVVNVYASQQVQARSPFAGDPFFEQFFGRRMPPRVQSSLGSGVLVDPTGYIVTNDHVIRGADEVRVALADGREFRSQILLRDESLDLAILKIDGPEPFPVVALGDSELLEVGDLVLAIGNPFGVGQTTTSGIVSGLARTHVGVSDFGFFIQTDAAINPGNSGGALVDMNGDVVGINTAIYSQSGGSIGIGFAIPANIVGAVIESAKAGLDYFERPYVGATFENVSPDAAEALGMERPSGALVTSVTPGAPAEAAGLRPGDLILSFNGVSIEHPDALGYRLATARLGSTATLGILRQGAQAQVEIEMVRAPEGTSPAEVDVGGRSPFAGTRVAELSPRLAQRLGIRSQAPQGAVVVDVQPGSPAARLGLRPRDIVLEVNGERIATADELQAAAGAQTRWWQFTLERDGRRLSQTIRY
jgi:Do/DeqQ family serine protease